MKKVFILIVILISIAAIPALACSCGWYETAQEHVDDTDVIFEGIVKKTQSSGFLWWRRTELKTQIKVTRKIKGIHKTQAIVLHDNPKICCICGVSFKKRTKVLVFAHRGDDGKLYTNSCSYPRQPRDEFEEIFNVMETAAE